MQEDSDLKEACDSFAKELVEYSIDTFLSEITDKKFLGFLRGHIALLSKQLQLNKIKSENKAKQFVDLKGIEKDVYSKFVKANPKYKQKRFQNYFETFHRGILYRLFDLLKQQPNVKSEIAKDASSLIADISEVDASGEISDAATWHQKFLNKFIIENDQGGTQLQANSVDLYIWPHNTNQLYQLSRLLYQKGFTTDPKAFAEGFLKNLTKPYNWLKTKTSFLYLMHLIFDEDIRLNDAVVDLIIERVIFKSEKRITNPDIIRAQFRDIKNYFGAPESNHPPQVSQIDRLYFQVFPKKKV